MFEMKFLLNFSKEVYKVIWRIKIYVNSDSIVLG